MTRTLMIQGAGSNVGKSLLVAGLCRAARWRGLSVAPFKPQNMSNNAAVTVDGGEVGRAQALQALACGLELSSDMNPVLLKPETDRGAQVVIHGRRRDTLTAREFATLKPSLMAPVLESFGRLQRAYELVIVEGAGSPAEVNLRAHDIANMGFARAADCPVVIVGDIDRGGVIAQLVGTRAVLDPADAALIKGFVINKFRGDPALFDDGYRVIEERIGWRGFGVVPWFGKAGDLPAEDALDIPVHAAGEGLRIAVPVLSRIANFDDLDPLASEPGVDLRMIRPGQPIPVCDLVILPGTKSTLGDLAFLRGQGWDIDILAHHRRGGHVLGICGGYQMLGKRVSDPCGIEGAAGERAGLGLLDIVTVMGENKRLARVRAVHSATRASMQGYEIHIGRSEGPDCARPFALIEGRAEGASTPDGRVSGSYLHGMFTDDLFRSAWLAGFGVQADAQGHGARVEETLDDLAAHLEEHLDVDGLLGIAG